MEIKTIIWDFDGVILLSNPIRVKGFEVILSKFPKEQVDRLLAYHSENGGLSRYNKIRYFFEVIRGEEISDLRVKELAQEFSEVMRRELTNTSLLNKEWLEFMENVSPLVIHHISSGSDGKELNYLCRELGIHHHFKHIFGSPTPKVELVAQILKTEHCDLDSTLLVGDAVNDLEAARENGISFFGYNNDELKNINSKYLEKLSHLLNYKNHVHH